MKNRRMTIFGFTVGMVLAGLLVTSPPTAMADTINITSCNNCGVSGPYGTVTLVQDGANVDVTIVADPGFSWKTRDGSDIFFNPTAGTNLTAASFEDDNGTPNDISANHGGLNATPFTFTQTPQNIAGLDFGIELSGIGTGDSAYNGVASVGEWEFKVLGVSVAQLEGTDANGVSWGVHTVCDGTQTGCTSGSNTFYATTTPTSVPDGGVTLMLLGGTLVGLETMRRRLRV
jgi:hypothetical protein